ncbi:manganese peroxidase 2 [Rhizoctonia solani]|uniref:Peroxidase n=1 Tax=Rhizoctonia solani TaxID=456999 RepID=A0A8H8P112_9AGAM|nr:manganese peroxidase 2 [Rhizoctonia solani]QRW22026.1 manganese peroxidase 2 [Rhizoctonia solani]
MISRLALLALFANLASADWTWPNPVWDEIEEITQVQGGVFRSGVLDGVTPCGSFPQSGNSDPSRQASSEWLLTAYHDAITHNAQEGTGGVDASLIWETNRAPNGRAFNGTFGFMLNYYSIRASMSDLIALATYTAVRNCQGPPLIMRAGRIDATGPAPDGFVPGPSDSITTLLSKFANAGFNKTDMIQMVACGHTIGGVHGQFFPELTGDSNRTNYVHFDTTPATFDNKAATEYLDGTSLNPLVTAPGGNNSDFTVFNSDGNSTIKAMSQPTKFLSTCGSILQRMIDTVPSTVKLSDPITPMKVKPHDLQLQLLSTGQIRLDGYIRVRSEDRGLSEQPAVRVMYADRTGQVNSTKIDTMPVRFQGGIGSGFEAVFWFYQIPSTILPKGISHFNVSLTNVTTRAETVYDNNGHGYPVQDNIIFQAAQSCQILNSDENGNGNLTMTAAVRDGMDLTNPSLNVVVKVPRANSVVPALVIRTVPMKLLRSTEFGYSLYSGSYSLPTESWSTTADVRVEGPNGVKYEDGFKKTSAFNDQCGEF